MNLKFETEGTDKGKITMWFDSPNDLNEFVTSLNLSDVHNWIINIDIDFTRLRFVVLLRMGR